MALRDQARGWSHLSGYHGLHVSTVPIAAAHPNVPARAATWLPGRHGLRTSEGSHPEMPISAPLTAPSASTGGLGARPGRRSERRSHRVQGGTPGKSIIQPERAMARAPGLAPCSRREP